MRILIQGLNKRNRRIRNTYYISGFSVKLFSAGFMIHLNKIEMHVKVSKAFNIRPLCHGWVLNPRLPDYEKSVLTSRPERVLFFVNLGLVFAVKCLCYTGP